MQRNKIFRVKKCPWFGLQIHFHILYVLFSINGTSMVHVVINTDQYRIIIVSMDQIQVKFNI